jgi:FAD binding domain
MIFIDRERHGGKLIMVKKRETKVAELRDQTAASRRDFVKAGAAAGLGAAILSAPGNAQAQPAPVRWDYEADVIVCGSGATGIVAAKRARDLGADVLVLEQNFDIGGKLSHNGGSSSFGGGDPIQERDRQGLADPDGWLSAPLVQAADVTDDPETLFIDTTDWSVINDHAVAEYRYNDRGLQRGWADNAAATRQFLMDNHVRWSRISSTHQGGGMTKARAARSIMKLGNKTDIEAGTITSADAGSMEEERQSLFNPATCGGPGARADAVGAPNCISGGFVISRSVEYSARKAGVRFMLHRHLDEIIREGRDSGKVIGVKASYTPRFSPKTGKRLEGYYSNGNIEETKQVIYVRARRAVIVATGGYMGNVPFRTSFDPRMSEPSMQYGTGLMGPLHEDASGILAGMKVGAGLGGLYQANLHTNTALRLQPVLAVSDVYDRVMPGHPAFEFIRSYGISIGTAGWEYIIAVNQVGKRFHDEWSIGNQRGLEAQWPPGMSGTKKPFTPLDWRNASVAHVRSSYAWGSGSDAALAMNEGSRAPDYSSGPVWAIFDQAAVDANGWKLRHPYIADPPNGTFFKADTIAELARLVVGNRFQRMPLKYLEQTVARFNGFVAAGKDTDFEKAVMHRIDKAPFYAALIPFAVNDSIGGLKIDGHCQVIDIYGKPIPGLFAGGEASGGGRAHGIGRACVHGYMAGTYAPAEPAA